VISPIRLVEFDRCDLSLGVGECCIRFVIFKLLYPTLFLHIAIVFITLQLCILIVISKNVITLLEKALRLLCVS